MGSEMARVNLDPDERQAHHRNRGLWQICVWCGAEFNGESFDGCCWWDCYRARQERKLRPLWNAYMEEWADALIYDAILSRAVKFISEGE